MEKKEMAEIMSETLEKSLPGVVEAVVEEKTKGLVEKNSELQETIKKLSSELKISSVKKGDEKDELEKRFVIKTFQIQMEKNCNFETAKSEAKAAFMNEGTAGEGEELVFDQFDKKILNVIEQYPVVSDVLMYNLAKGDNLTLPKVLNTLTTAWASEGTSGTPGKAATSGILIQVKKALSLVDVSTELFEDNMTVPELFNLLVAFIGESMGSFMEDQLINGDGTGDNFLGILADTNIGKVTMAATNTSFDDVSDDDLIDMIGKIGRKYERNFGGVTKFYGSKWVKTRLMKLKTTTGDILYPELRNSKPTLIGYDFVESVAMPGEAEDDISTKFLIIGNFKNYAVVRRKDLNIERGFSGDGFKNGITTIRGEQRAHGSIVFTEGFVTLETAAA